MNKISSDVLKEYISVRLGKNIEDIIENDLDIIESISLQKIDFDDKETDCTIKDLIEFRNLTSCTLCDFDIDNESIEIINKLEKLEFIHFDFCDFLAENIYFNINTEDVCFNMCENLSLKKIQNTKLNSIEIIGNLENIKELDIVELGKVENLTELSIHNCNIKNIEKILEIAPKLERLDIDGSNCEEENLQNIIDKIEISHEKDFLLGEEPIWD